MTQARCPLSLIGTSGSTRRTPVSGRAYIESSHSMLLEVLSRIGRGQTFP